MYIVSFVPVTSVSPCTVDMPRKQKSLASALPEPTASGVPAGILAMLGGRIAPSHASSSRPTLSSADEPANALVRSKRGGKKARGTRGGKAVKVKASAKAAPALQHTPSTSQLQHFFDDDIPVWETPTPRNLLSDFDNVWTRQSSSSPTSLVTEPSVCSDVTYDRSPDIDCEQPPFVPNMEDKLQPWLANDLSLTSPLASLPIRSASAPATCVASSPSCSAAPSSVRTEVDADELPTTDSALQGQEYGDHCLDVMLRDFCGVTSGSYQDEIDNQLGVIMSRFDGTYSHTCAGVDAVTIALREFSSAVKRRLSHVVVWEGPKCQHLIEWDKENCAELSLLHPSGTTCVFGDLHSFFVDEIQNKLWLMHRRPEIAWESLLPLVRLGKATQTKAWCFAHNAYCDQKPTDCAFGGTPCTDFTSNNNFQPRGAGFTMVTLCAFSSNRILLGDKRFVYENCDGVAKYLKEAVGHVYYIDLQTNDVMFNPINLGHATNRDRKYLDARHKVHSLADFSPLCRFYKRFWRIVNYHWQEHFFCHEHEHFDAELDADLRWAQSRRTATSHSWETYDSGRCGQHTFLRALADAELIHMQQYYDGGVRKGSLVQLNQNPEFHGQSSSLDQPIQHSIVRQCGLLWSHVFNRWQAGSETLFAMGWRTHPAAQLSVTYLSQPLHSFALQRYDRSSRIMRCQAGDTMHVHCVLVAALHAFWCNSRPRDSMALDAASLSFFANVVGQLAGRAKL